MVHGRHSLIGSNFGSAIVWVLLHSTLDVISLSQASPWGTLATQGRARVVREVLMILLVYTDLFLLTYINCPYLLSSRSLAWIESILCVQVFDYNGRVESNLINLAAPKHAMTVMEIRRTVPICSCNLSCSNLGPGRAYCFPSFDSFCPSRKTTQCLSGRVACTLVANNIHGRFMTGERLMRIRGTRQTVSTQHNHDCSPILKYILP